MGALRRALARWASLLRLALLVLAGGCSCSCWPGSRRSRNGRWHRRLAARLRVHGGEGRAARVPPLDGTVAYVDGSVDGSGDMGAGIFYGVGHALNRSVRLSQPVPGPAWQCDRVGSGDPNLAELGAIYLALLFHPAERPLTLCTDSLFALQQLRWLTDQPRGGPGAAPPSGWGHPRFAACLAAIAWLVYLREGRLVLHKVQAHTGGHRHAAGNAMADALAVSAVLEGAPLFALPAAATSTSISWRDCRRFCGCGNARVGFAMRANRGRVEEAEVYATAHHPDGVGWAGLTGQAPDGGGCTTTEAAGWFGLGWSHSCGACAWGCAGGWTETEAGGVCGGCAWRGFLRSAASASEAAAATAGETESGA